MVVLCIWFGLKARSARHQKTMVAELGRVGGVVRYENEEIDFFTGRVVERTSPLAGWIYGVLGKDVFYEVTEFSGNLSQVEVGLPYLRELPELEKVTIFIYGSGSEVELKKADELVRALQTALPNAEVEHEEV
jgi:hypothetical protein